MANASDADIVANADRMEQFANNPVTLAREWAKVYAPIPRSLPHTHKTPRRDNQAMLEQYIEQLRQMTPEMFKQRQEQMNNMTPEG